MLSKAHFDMLIVHGISVPVLSKAPLMMLSDYSQQLIAEVEHYAGTATCAPSMPDRQLCHVSSLPAPSHLPSWLCRLQHLEVRHSRRDVPVHAWLGIEHHDCAAE